VVIGLTMSASVIASMFQVLAFLVYRSAMATTALFALLVGASIAVDRLTRARVERQSAGLEFVG
jgi:type IV secretory pathway VirB3-like protein